MPALAASLAGEMVQPHSEDEFEDFEEEYEDDGEYEEEDEGEALDGEIDADEEAIGGDLLGGERREMAGRRPRWMSRAIGTPLGDAGGDVRRPGGQESAAERRRGVISALGGDGSRQPQPSRRRRRG